MNKYTFRLWHRRIGIGSLFMVLWLALSGSLLNHGDALTLNKIQINNAWLNRLYGLDQSVHIPQAFFISNNYFFCFQGELYSNADVLSACEFDLIGVTSIKRDFEDIEGINHQQTQFVLLNEVELIVLDENFRVFDNIDLSLLGKSFEEIRAYQDTVVLREKGSSIFWRVDLNAINIEIFEDVSVISKLPELQPTNLSEDIVNLLSFPGISLERILLDAHSGRLFGSMGVLFVDLFALAFALLGISGLWIFFKKSH